MGSGFIVVISPSKAAICPDLAPPGWAQGMDPRPRFSTLLVQQLRAQGINYFDGRLPTLQSRDSQLGDISFPKGGVHWGDVPSFLTATVTLDELGKQGLPLSPLIPTNTVVHETPWSWEDQDLLRLLNLVYPWRFRCASIQSQPTRLRPSQKLSLVVMGGSFCNQLVENWFASNQFCEIDFYYYRLTSKRCYANGVQNVRSTVSLDGRTLLRSMSRFSVKPKTFDFRRDILAADAVILEINEASKKGNICWN